LVDEIKPYVEKVPHLTSYEIQTALAFWHFAREKVDIAVVEVGLGGRLDSTNVVTPLVSVITSISLDHVSILGDTLSAIAAEKGGIIKADIPVVSAPQKVEAREILKGLAAEKQAQFTQVGEKVRFEVGDGSLAGQKFAVFSQKGSDRLDLNIPLLGLHQVENAVTAYAALAAAREGGLEIKNEEIKEGFASVVWPGRFEVVSENPYVIFDVAHNRDSAKRLWEAVKTYLPGKATTLIFGALADKDIPGMFAELLPYVKTLLIVQPEHPRAASIENLAEYADLYECEKINVKDISVIWEKARQITGEDGVILVTGSLTTVGELRASWMQKFAEDGYNS
jgi:dihydrofolate synthase/folylpolyglutamate synthase